MILLCSCITIGCSDYLDITPKGVLSAELLEGPDNVEGFVTAAYSWAPQTHTYYSLNSWQHGSIKSDDAYKGGGGLSDQTPWHLMELFTPVSSEVGNNNDVWIYTYRGISRCNDAIRMLQKLELSDFPQRDVRIGEMKFLRGYFYFKLILIYKHVIFIDEDTEQDSEIHESFSNRTMTHMQLWERTLADFTEAVRLLPEQQPATEKARVNQIAAKAMCGKVLLYMAYEQDDRHQVININKTRLQEALTYFDDIISKEGGLVDLQPDIAENFMEEYDMATKEAIYEINYSYNDGISNGRTNRGNGLVAPWWPPYFECCDFHKATYNLANAFRTDANGLPLFDTFNDAELSNNKERWLADNTFDPRFSHTIAFPDHPWKYDPTILFDSAGSRAPFQYGYMHMHKEQVHPSCDCQSHEFWEYNALNTKNIRYAEVLLWKAEILIQLDRQDEALPLINKIRQRAANSTGRLKFADGTPVMNYKIGLYEPGVNCTWTKEFALKAMQWENRLELAGEGRRFFNLLRWGILEPTINAYFAKEMTREGREWIESGHFIAGRDEYRPIPQAQIALSRGVYVQNPGY